MSFEDLQKSLKISFKNDSLLKQAFIHRSYLNETKLTLESNERLEFLGDSILSFLISDYLYKTFPQLPEGSLTSLRSAVVNTKSLADCAKTLFLGKLLKLSRGEDEGGGRENISILADTFEALIGAIYLDTDLKTVKRITLTHLTPRLKEVIENKTYKDPKSTFQEVVQEKLRISPTYKVIKEVGPDHSKIFTVGVFVADTLYGTGQGKNKQEGEQNAASHALAAWLK
ncbi:ribonuclease III [Candidatus Gottesmanbacteria bacterium]|nr:ribonuclease III [Candidatus Gottesmanbacteria bacterium]